MRAPWFLALLLVGCLNPDELVPLTGRVVTVGSPEGQPIQLLRTRTNSLLQFRCEFDGVPTWRTEPADADGGYRFDLLRAETDALSGSTQFCLRVQADFPSGSRAWTEPHRGSLRLTGGGALREWRSNLGLDAGVLDFAPVIPWPDEEPRFDAQNRPVPAVQLTHRVELRTSDGGLAWRADDRVTPTDGGFLFVRGPLRMGPFETEDFEGDVELRAFLDEAELVANGIYTEGLAPVFLRAERSPRIVGVTMPLSRGLPCPPFASPCPLTDGSLEHADAGLLPEVVIELGAEQPVSAIVLRGAEVAGSPIHVQLEASDGGVAFEHERRVTYEAFFDPRGSPTLTLPDGGYRSVQTVFARIDVGGVSASRLRLTFGDGLVRIAELSVF